MNPYHAIADANRRQMLDLLRTQGPLRAGEIVAHFPQISQPAVSKHLRVLRQAKLVRSTKSGREQWYHLDPVPLQLVSSWLEEYATLWEQRLERLSEVAKQTAPQANPPTEMNLEPTMRSQLQVQKGRKVDDKSNNKSGDTTNDKSSDKSSDTSYVPA